MQVEGRTKFILSVRAGNAANILDFTLVVRSSIGMEDIVKPGGRLGVVPHAA